MWPDSTLTIAKSQRQGCFQFLSEYTTSNFFIFLMAGSTDSDSGNLEVELILVSFFCVKDDNVGEIQARSRYLYVVKPTRADADG